MKSLFDFYSIMFKHTTLPVNYYANAPTFDKQTGGVK